MTTAAKHHYRFVYLRSEKWKGVRIEAMAREMARCQICNEEDLSNDAHHVFYPDSMWDTTSEHVVILCRPCHELAQCLFVQQSNLKDGMNCFNNLVRVIKSWILKKRAWIEYKTNKELRVRNFKFKTGNGCFACGNNSNISNVDLFSLLKFPTQGKYEKSMCEGCIEDISIGVIIYQGESKNDFFKKVRVWIKKRA